MDPERADMDFSLFDTHCHLASERYAIDLPEVIRSCREAGVRALAAGVDVASSRLNLELAASHDGVLAAVGVHPTGVLELDEEGWREISRLAASPLAVAVGETGLDYYWKDVPPAAQAKWFDRHIELALALGKPLLLHARESIPDVVSRLEPHFTSGLKVLWHCFSAGKKEMASALEFALAHGVGLALGGLVTFEDQKTLRRHVPLIPDDLLFLETDAPYLSPRPKLSDRNEPARIVRVAEVVAELRGRSPEDIARLTSRNAERLFGLPETKAE
jgi:TatD DNase family protein